MEQRRSSRLGNAMTGGEMLSVETGAVWILGEAAGHLSPSLNPCICPSLTSMRRFAEPSSEALWSRRRSTAFRVRHTPFLFLASLSSSSRPLSKFLNLVGLFLSENGTNNIFFIKLLKIGIKKCEESSTVLGMKYVLTLNVYIL